MKTTTRIKSLIVVSILASVSQTFAAENGDTMMKDDKMMMATGSLTTGDKMVMDKMIKKDDTMMKDDKMMSDKTMMMKDYKKLSVALLAKKLGYTWKSDRKILAEKSGVTNYKDTAKQNLKIREYLLTMVK